MLSKLSVNMISRYRLKTVRVLGIATPAVNIPVLLLYINMHLKDETEFMSAINKQMIA